MSDATDTWSKATITTLTSDVHDTLRTFTETLLEQDEGQLINDGHPLSDEYEAVIHAQWALHNYLYPEEQ